MVDKIEMSLDDIIKSNKSLKPRRVGGVRRGGSSSGSRPIRKSTRPDSSSSSSRRPGVLGRGVLKGRDRGGIQKSRFPRGDVNSAWKHDMYDGSKRSLGAIGGHAKLLISNLDYGVSESDIHELFNEFGPIRSASVHFDRSGRSLGTGDVVFERRANALKAMKQYNGVPLDGRPMNIQLATSDVPATKSRLTPPSIGGRSRLPIGARRGSGSGVRRNVGQRNGASNRRITKKEAGPTAEQLDAELDAYVNDMK